MFALVELVASLSVLACLWLKWRTDIISIPHALIRVPPDAVMVHTYKPEQGHVPDRGKLVLERGWLMAKHYACPLLLAVGRTVPEEKRTEGEIYRDYALLNFGNGVNIIVGEDSTVRDTAGEVRKAVAIARMLETRRLLVVASRPHLYRCSELWRQTPRGDISVVLYGEHCAIEYYLWEVAMIIFEKLLPSGSKRRDFVLNFIGRRG